MGNRFLIKIACIFAALIIISCSIANSNQNDDGTKTITAKFLDAGSLEGEATMTFVKEDGNKIDFFRNYTNPEEPKLNFEFVSKEGIGGNPELIGKTFIIKYIEKPNGGPTGRIGEGEACKQILSVEKK